MAIIKGRRNHNGVRPRGAIIAGMWVVQRSTLRVGIAVDVPAIIPTGSEDVETPSEEEVVDAEGKTVLDAKGEPETHIVMRLVPHTVYADDPTRINVHFVDDAGDTIMHDEPDPNDAAKTISTAHNLIAVDDVVQATHATIKPHLAARQSELPLALAHRLGYDQTPEAIAAHQAALDAASIESRVRATLRGASSTFVAALKKAIGQE